ncbi:hypothetical protein [Pseudoduganella namucuonensis]|uniref:DUF4148 domain-containing protein n=1 Tax=Pseudoduganella namucuonensis TaxID=1035707 RepID=A0A1I7JLR7_9BURK|nr:hypothetical protein [Pseudoduganella namucuonensis]SFU86129.1 hypothetical protein SAMN05216552_101235 [Pseudoduganella namucuonensis]
MSKQLHNSNASPRAHELVRVCVGTLAVCFSLLGVSAHANGPGDRDAPPRKEERGDNRPQRPERDSRSFEARAEEHRRVLQESTSNAETARRAGRMTPDERRDLRRQINEAGQEVYAIPPRR